jgi:hypothetical protein
MSADVCDDCLNVAYDLIGTKGGLEAQEDLMREIGQELEDHSCEAVEEPEIECSCACHPQH